MLASLTRKYGKDDFHFTFLYTTVQGPVNKKSETDFEGAPGLPIPGPHWREEEL